MYYGSNTFFPGGSRLDLDLKLKKFVFKKNGKPIKTGLINLAVQCFSF